MTERQTNYTIGEGMSLPSKGLIYGRPVNEFVELRSMTARDEMKRLSPTSSQFRLLSEIIEGCMIEKPAIKVYDMAIGDYEFLLHKLRTITYGDEYKMEIRCPFCGKLVESIAHLEELKLQVIEPEQFEAARNIVLPVGGQHLVLNFMTPHIMDMTESTVKELKRKFKDAEVDFETLVRLKFAIDTVDSVKLSDTALENFINKLPAKDLLKIENSLAELNLQFGIDNKLEITCDGCGGEVPTYFRYGPEFFRPTTI